MKTKLLSKLMLVCFTAVMIVGCDTGKESSTEGADATKTDSAETRAAVAPPPPDPCIVCDEKEDHRISSDEFEKLIMRFDSAFVSPGIFNNHGGVIVLEDNSKEKNSLTQTYPTFKLHLGVENSGSTKRLLVTYEKESASCIKGKYQGELGIYSKLPFLTSHVNNDIVIPKLGKLIKPFDINKHFFTNTSYVINIDRRNVIDSANARRLLNNFKQFDTNRNLYFCDDIIFNINKTLDEITSFSNRDAFQYYFGYDDKMQYHKIRLILVGIDKNDKLVMFDATGDYLFRETSRPRP